MQHLWGRVAVITGAGSGIGRGIAFACLRYQMKLVLADIEPEALSRVVGEISAAGGEVVGLVTDVSDPMSVNRLAESAFDRHGAVHLLCNNAGVIDNNQPSWACSSADWQWVLGVNLMGVVHGLGAFVPWMLRMATTDTL